MKPLSPEERKRIAALKAGAVNDPNTPEDMEEEPTEEREEDTSPSPVKNLLKKLRRPGAS